MTLLEELADPCHCLDQLQARFGPQGLEAVRRCMANCRAMTQNLANQNQSLDSLEAMAYR